MEVPQKIKNRPTYHPAIAIVGIYPRDTGMLFQRGICTTMFIAALAIRAKVWKESKCPSMDEWIKMWCVYIYICMYVYTHTHTQWSTQQ